MPTRKKSRRVKEANKEPNRKSFEWLNTYRGRRGALQLIRQTIREGWVDDPDRRQELVTALNRLPLLSMQDREFIQLSWAYLEMHKSNLADILEALAGGK